MKILAIKANVAPSVRCLLFSTGRRLAHLEKECWVGRKNIFKKKTAQKWNTIDKRMKSAWISLSVVVVYLRMLAVAFLSWGRRSGSLSTSSSRPITDSFSSWFISKSWSGDQNFSSKSSWERATVTYAPLSQPVYAPINLTLTLKNKAHICSKSGKCPAVPPNAHYPHHKVPLILFPYETQ